MKLKQLESLLQQVRPFSRPQIQLEQYQTSPHVAASLLMDQEHVFAGSTVADLGCGTGILSAGPLFLGADSVLAVDLDPDALTVCQENLWSCFAAQDEDPDDDGDSIVSRTAAAYDLVQADVCHLPLHAGRVPDDSGFDVVMMNPPFGTRNPGIDMTFLQTALSLVKREEGIVLSLHKSSTRDGIARRCRTWNVDMEVLAEVRFDLPASYSFHKKRSADVAVDFIQFTKL